MQTFKVIFQSRIWRLPVRLTVLLATVFGGVALGLRNTSGNYCLLYAPRQGMNVYATLYDLHSNHKAIITTNQPITDSTPEPNYDDVDPYASTQVLRVSPNKRYTAHLLVPYIVQAGVNYGLNVELPKDTVPVESKGIRQIAWLSDNSILYNTGASISRYDPATGESRTVPFPENWSTASLSPDGKFLAVIDATNQVSKPTLSVVSTAPIFDQQTDFQPVAYTIPRMGFVRWSPDSRHFVTFYFSPEYTGWGGGGSALADIQNRLIYMDLFSIDGDAHDNFASLLMRETEFGSMFFPARWSPDGQSLLYLQSDSETNSQHLMAFNVSTGIHKRLRDNVVGSLYFSFENLPFYDYDTPAQERIAVVYRIKDRYRAEMLDTNGTLQQVIVNNADWVSEPLWLRDGNTLVLLWSQGYGSQRHAHLTLTFANGNAPKDFDAGYQEITDFQRLHGKNKDGQPLNAFIYKVHYGDYYGVNVLDLDTFKEYRLARDLADVIAIEQNMDIIRYWWKTPDNVYGVSDYSLDRQLLNQLYLKNPFDEAGSVFYSTDKQAALAITSRDNHMEAQLTGADGRTQVILPSITSIPYEVVWSTDRKLVAAAHDSLIEAFETSSGSRVLSQRISWSREGLSFTSCKELDPK